LWLFLCLLQICTEPVFKELVFRDSKQEDIWGLPLLRLEDSGGSSSEYPGIKTSVEAVANSKDKLNLPG
jgi:hypothetical protein